MDGQRQPGLPVRVKLFWGVAGLGAEALRQSRNAWLIFFYTSSSAAHGARLSLALVSVLLFAGKLIEAFVDPLVGHLSDRTTSPIGRRLPFVVLATPPMALFAALMFLPLGNPGSVTTAIYFFAVLEVYFLLSSLVNVPFEALMPEIAPAGDERITLTAWRVYFGVAGAAVGLVGSGLLISAVGFRGMAVAMATLALVTRYAGVAGIWTRVKRDSPKTTLPFRQTLKLTVTHRRFVSFMLSFVLFMTGLTMVIGLLPFYVTNVLQERDTGLWSSVLTAVAIGSMAAAIPIFAQWGKHTSKGQAYRRAMLVSACAFPVLLVTGLIPGISTVAQSLVAMVLIGAPVAGVYLFPGPIIADFCDEDTEARGLYREGAFYSVQSFTDKLIEAFGPLLLGLVLLLGNTPTDLLGVRLVGPVAGALVFVGFLLSRTLDRPARVPKQSMISTPAEDPAGRFATEPTAPNSAHDAHPG